MATNQSLDELIRSWLQETAPAEIPARVLEDAAQRTRTSRQQINWRSLLERSSIVRFVPALGSAAVVVVVTALVVTLVGNRQIGPEGSPSTDPRSAFLGVWISTSDADGGTQSMTVERSADLTVRIVVTDTLATVCSGTSSTMIGTGSVESGRLVIPAPDYQCDDGTEPKTPGRPPLSEQLRNLTYSHDAQTDTLSVGVGDVWSRKGAVEPTSDPIPDRTASGGMWPQASMDEVRAAQAGADTGDPDYTWQVDPQLFIDDTWIGHHRPELVDRFLRDVLGWEAYTLNPFEGMARDGVYDVFYDQRYLRCAPGRTNPLYPPGPEPGWGELCAPTLDDLRYESVSLDLAQLDRQASDGIWVVNRWRLTAPFAQADPVAAEAQATGRLEEFLAARIAGQGAEGRVQVDVDIDVPLMYATTSGAPYERYELGISDGPEWPHGRMTFSVRLFADGDATVVEQEIPREPDGTLLLDANSTTENGQPVNVPYASSDGKVSVSVPSTWETWSGGGTNHAGAPGVWFWEFYRDRDENGGQDRIEFTDPVAYDAWCAANGGSPLLSVPADAAAIAQQVIADPNFETTAPVITRVGGLDAVSIEVVLAPGGKGCGVGIIEISRWIHSLQPGLRLALYLVDLPDGMSVETLAITVLAPEERFDEVIAETAPIIDSIQFHMN